MEASNAREFTRVPTRIRAEVAAGGLRITDGAAQTLSLKGMFLVCAVPLPEGTECAITLLLGDGEARVEAEGKVVHAYPEGLALQFTRILGLESFEHLRKLVLYNAPDPGLVESEFDAATGIHRKA